VKLLMDTHVILWAPGRPGRLSAPTRRRIEDPNNVVFVSAASTWEIEIKRALGKLAAPDDLPEQMRRARFTELPLHIRHVQQLRTLPGLHRDPFDRILVSQAMTDDLVLITNDEDIRACGCKTMRC
jgi:PIN domain nuclease of toxin-antitoxin system